MSEETLHMYARGFQLSEEDVPSPNPGWIPQKALGLITYRDPRTKLAVVEAKHLGVAIVGKVIDLADPSAGSDAIANNALQFLRISREAFLDYASSLGGRHLIVYRKDGLHVLGDATCSLSCFYSAESPLIAASHARIVAEVRGARANPLLDDLEGHPAWRRPRPARSYPGDQTPFKGRLPLDRQRNSECIRHVDSAILANQTS